MHPMHFEKYTEYTVILFFFFKETKPFMFAKVLSKQED